MHALAGFAMSLVYSLGAAGAFLLSRAVLQPDHWWNPGLGWIAVVVCSIGLLAGGTALVLRAAHRRRRSSAGSKNSLTR